MRGEATKQRKTGKVEDRRGVRVVSAEEALDRVV